MVETIETMDEELSFKTTINTVPKASYDYKVAHNLSDNSHNLCHELKVILMISYSKFILLALSTHSKRLSKVIANT